MARRNRAWFVMCAHALSDNACLRPPHSTTGADISFGRREGRWVGRRWHASKVHVRARRAQPRPCRLRAGPCGFVSSACTWTRVGWRCWGCQMIVATVVGHCSPHSLSLALGGWRKRERKSQRERVRTWPVLTFLLGGGASPPLTNGLGLFVFSYKSSLPSLSCFERPSLCALAPMVSR